MSNDRTPTPEQLQREIQAQRSQLADTVDQLAHRLDVPTRARARVAGLRDSATTADGRPHPALLAAAGSLLAVTVVLVAWRVRR